MGRNSDIFNKIQAFLFRKTIYGNMNFKIVGILIKPGLNTKMLRKQMNSFKQRFFSSHLFTSVPHQKLSSMYKTMCCDIKSVRYVIDGRSEAYEFMRRKELVYLKLHSNFKKVIFSVVYGFCNLTFIIWYKFHSYEPKWYEGVMKLIRRHQFKLFWLKNLIETQ